MTDETLILIEKRPVHKTKNKNAYIRKQKEIRKRFGKQKKTCIYTQRW